MLLPPQLYANYIGVKHGDDCRFVSKNWGSEPYLIEIGNHVHITKGVSFITHDGSVWVFRDKIKDFDIFGKIKIKNNVYIGNNTIIFPGVTIGNNCIIGANSLVTKSIPDNCVCAGNPIRYISSTSSIGKKLIQYNTATKGAPSRKKKKVLLDPNFSLFMVKGTLKIID
jgi:acetyltransferase-like isoleucine patch superfamily enzyme